jgi:hypothetical protein
MNTPHKMGIDPRKPQLKELHEKAEALGAMPKPRPIGDAFTPLRAVARATKPPRKV